MSYSRVFSENAIAGIRRIFHADADGENYTIETTQDVTALIEANKAIMAHKGFGKTQKFGGNQVAHHVRSIPLSVFFELKRKGILGDEHTILDEPAFQKWLNDSDNAAWRTHEGKI